MTSLLDVQNVHAGYGTVQILRGVSLSIQAGELVDVRIDEVRAFSLSGTLA